MVPLPKPQRVREAKYLDFIRSQPCCLFGIKPHYCFQDAEFIITGLRQRVEAHHVSREGHKGMGTKPDDRRTVPVCFDAHRYAEQHPKDVREHFERVIASLNTAYDSLYPERKSTEQRKKTCRFFLQVKNCPGCGRDHPAVPLRKAELQAATVGVSGQQIRFWCSRRGRYFTSLI